MRHTLIVIRTNPWNANRKQGVDISRLSIGSVLCKGKSAVPVARRFLTQISVLPSVRMPILRVKT